MSNKHRSGFVNIIGNPNVGKSTLMNVLVGERMSIITPKAQTTRDRIMGIVNGDDFQIVYSDTPGVIEPGYELHERMMKSVYTALNDADMILFMTDVTESEKSTESTVEKLNRVEIPLLVLINKVDLVEQDEVAALAAAWTKKLPKATVLPISALNKFNTKGVFEIILEHLPESPPYFPKDQLTDKPQRFFISEIIREKIFKFYKQEIPYSAAVVIESFKEEEEIVRIRAEIIVERDSQKGIVIGHKGKALKNVGTHARREIENFLQKKVFLQTFVKVDKDWRKNAASLKNLGYGE